MLTLLRRSELLAEATRLNDAHDYPAIAAFLAPLSRPELLAEPELGYLLAQAWYRLGHDADAHALVVDLAEPCARRGKDRLFARRLNLEGALLVEAGDLNRAHQAFLQVLIVGTAVEDHELPAHATVNLGIIASFRGQWHPALAAFQRAIAAYAITRNSYLIAACHQDIGMTYRHLGFTQEADEHLTQAFTEYRRGGMERDLAVNEAERALLLEMTGDRQLAEITASRALERSRRIGSLRVEGAVRRVLGVISFGDGNSARAREHFVAALRIARTVNARLLHAEVAEDMAVLATVEGNPKGAYMHRRIAEQLYNRMDAYERVESMRRRLLGVTKRSISGSTI